MGSKQNMLKNGLGELISREIPRSSRFVDLFTGAGFVACHVAENDNIPVLAVDMQLYATTLTKAIIGRIKEVDPTTLEINWIQKAIEARNNSKEWNEIKTLGAIELTNPEIVIKSREICKKSYNVGPCWKAYGGYYFSPAQALTLDFLLENIPKKDPEKTVCLAALISAASECAASPGHTAQPFQPTNTAFPFIVDAWSRDPIEHSLKSLRKICPHHAQIVGKILTADALLVANTVDEDDLVFIDPPYSDVQYSRFYHVLETIARGDKDIFVFGKGRYPPIDERPQSNFSKKGQSKDALIALLRTLGEKKCRIIFTFPSGIASNGLSGDYIKTVANEWFQVEDHTTVKGLFSTMGGNNFTRNARNASSELILFMKPK